MPTVRILLRLGVIGEDQRDWLPGTIHEASVGFARELIARGAALPADGVEPPATPLTTTSAAASADAPHVDRAVVPGVREPKRGRK